MIGSKMTFCPEAGSYPQGGYQLKRFETLIVLGLRVQLVFSRILGTKVHARKQATPIAGVI